MSERRFALALEAINQLDTALEFAHKAYLAGLESFFLNHSGDLACIEWDWENENLAGISQPYYELTLKRKDGATYYLGERYRLASDLHHVTADLMDTCDRCEARADAAKVEGLDDEDTLAAVMSEFTGIHSALVLDYLSAFYDWLNARRQHDGRTRLSFVDNEQSKLEGKAQVGPAEPSGE